MKSYLFEELETIVKNEPMAVIKYIDSISLEHKTKIFPNFIEYYQQAFYIRKRGPVHFKIVLDISNSFLTGSQYNLNLNNG